MKLLCLLFTLAAASPLATASPSTIAMSPDASNANWTFKNGSSDIHIQTTGNVTFDPDSDAVFDLHGNGTLRIIERSSTDVRVLTAKGSQIAWTVNGKPQPYDAGGKDWLRKILKARPATPTPPTPPPPPK